MYPALDTEDEPTVDLLLDQVPVRAMTLVETVVVEYDDEPTVVEPLVPQEMRPEIPPDLYLPYFVDAAKRLFAEWRRRFQATLEFDRTHFPNNLDQRLLRFLRRCLLQAKANLAK